MLEVNLFMDVPTITRDLHSNSFVDCELADVALKERTRKFKIFLTKRFKWSFDMQDE